MSLELTTDNFDELVINSDKPVLVDFTATWCGPCKMVGPIVDELGEELKDQLVTGKLDVDSNQPIAQKYGVRNIPTLLVIKNGEVVEKIVGAVPKPALLKKIEPHL